MAPGVRHNPVFGSPGEEFPPLHPLPHPSSPHPPDPHTVPGARGHLLGSLKQVGSATQASATGARRGTPKEKAERGRQGPTQDKGVGVRRPQAQKLPPPQLRPGSGGAPASFRGLAGAPVCPSASVRPSCLPSDQGIVLWGKRWGGVAGQEAGGEEGRLRCLCFSWGCQHPPLRPAGG